MVLNCFLSATLCTRSSQCWLGMLLLGVVQPEHLSSESFKIQPQSGRKKTTVNEVAKDKILNKQMADK